MHFMKKLIKKFLRKTLYKNISLLEWLNRWGVLTKNQCYDEWAILLMEKVLQNDAVCVDVGAHRGSILQFMLDTAPDGEFFAFEPLPHLYEYLVDLFGSNKKISLYNIALSDKAGESSFNYVVTNPGYSGLVKRHYDRPEEDTTITVKIDLMDNLLKDHHVDFIKIDVEGAEYQVLQGGKEVIKRDKPTIVFEHGKGAADCYGTKPEDVFDLLHDYCGLQLTLLNNYLKGRAPLSRDEFCDQFNRIVNYFFLAYSEKQSAAVRL